MRMDKDFYQDNLEWEVLDKNEMVIRITAEKGVYNVNETWKIKIQRDEEYKLTAEISGIVENHEDVSPKSHETKGTFLEGVTFYGYTANGLHEVKLTSCIIGSISFSEISLDDKEYSFRAELIFDKIEKSLNTHIIKPYKTGKIHEWYLCGSNDFLWTRSTKRVLNRVYQKDRFSVDKETNSKPIRSTSTSRDFVFIECENFSFIVSEVPQRYEPSWSNSITIEYRVSFGKIPSEEARNAIAEIIGFIFGHQLLKIGETHYEEQSENVKLQIFSSPWGDNVINRCQKGGLPPINIKGVKNSMKLEKLIRDLLPKYLEKRATLNLDQILWKYWVSKYSAIGVNLPILSSAVESLASKLIKENPSFKLYYIEKEKFSDLIREELVSIEAKLSQHEHKEKILNKIRFAANRGSNEKLNILFEILDIEIGGIEKKAIKARNKMAHSSLQNANDDQIKELIKLSRVYETLFNRIFLRILSYDGNYIDYYTIGCPEKNVRKSIE